MFPKPDIIVVVIVGNIIIRSDGVLPNDNLWHNISRKNWIKNGNNIKIRLKKKLDKKWNKINLRWNIFTEMESASVSSTQ